MFSYSYKFKLSPKNPNVITLTPTASTYAKAFAAPYIALAGLAAIAVVVGHFIEEPKLEEKDTIPSE
jgi:hypothetical protein